ncbi:hypothetical protein DRZ77_00495 [Candidatus Woesearchaeota archaeon]|nr:hypothetical protein [Candidatus Woesearchaeota archaeon]RLE41072.1 MAG: hypothetical protein DRZ77_00495 [Candidatus Woesearchaeota archaeon]
MIEDVQKVNKLAQELLDQGIVEDRTKAVEMAEAILRKKVASVKYLKEKDISGSQTVPELTLEQLKAIFDRSKDMLQKQIDSLQKELAKISNELKMIKEKINVPIKGQTALKTEKDTATSVNADSNAEKKPHPKVGSFTPEDVSIEKMFYYGDKKNE